MGYRSDGAIYLSEEAQELLTDELKKDLEEWEKNEIEENVWNFEYWKWYSDYEDVARWEDFMAMLGKEENHHIEWDFIRIGEEPDDTEISTGEKFGVSRIISYWD